MHFLYQALFLSLAAGLLSLSIYVDSAIDQKWKQFYCLQHVGLMKLVDQKKTDSLLPFQCNKISLQRI